MKSLSTVGLSLSLVFGCLLLALVAELYYLLWWKNRVCRREMLDHNYTTPSRDYFHKFCIEKPLFFSSTSLNTHQVCNSTHTHEPQIFLSGPPRFLFTIKEETNEDLEREEGRSRRGSSGRTEFFVNGDETPYFTPISSPLYYTPPLTPLDPNHKHHGFNPLFELSDDAEFCKLRSSPPPKFKFLKDAEDKLYRKKLMEKDFKENPSTSNLFHKDDENGSFIRLVVANDYRSGSNPRKS